LDYYHDDPIEPTSSRWRKLPGVLSLLVAISVGGTYLQNTLAANINLNSASAVEFGQGMSVITACATTAPGLTLTPYSNFTNQGGSSGTYYFSGFSVSRIPSGCNGATFSLSAYSTSGNSAITLFGTDSVAKILDTNGSYTSGSGANINVTTNSATSFTVSFASPLALTTSVAKLTLQSSTEATIFNYNSGLFTAGKYMTISPGIAFGSGAFTIEAWIKTASVVHGGDIIGNTNASNSLSLILDGPTEAHVDGFGLTAYHFALPVTLQGNTWYHIAIARNSSLKEQLWVNGQASPSSWQSGNSGSAGPISDSINYYSVSNGINYAYCTWCVPGNSVFDGERITNLRAVVGSNLYDPNATNITVPTAPLNLVTNTKLLMLFNSSSDLSVDSSGNQTVSNNGVTFVQGS
jgi:hypothetical protein